MLQLIVTLVVWTVLVVAAVRAVLPPLGSETAEHCRRRRAEWASVAAAIVTGYLVAVCIVRAGLGGPPDPYGVIVFLVLAAVVALDVLVLRSLWRDVARDRRAAADAQRAAIFGNAPVVDERPHRGLTGEDLPPTRW